MGNTTNSRVTAAPNAASPSPSGIIHLDPNLTTNLTVGLMAPPMNLPNLKLFMVFIYSVMSLAIFFNLRVIYIVVRILCRRQVGGAKPSRHGAVGGNQHAFVYVLSLSVVDSLVLAHMPFVATDIITGWVFGSALCKLFYMIEQVNRILSTFILTALSGDRYLAVCQPLRFRHLRTTKAAVWFIVVSGVVAGVSLTPVYIYTHVVEFHANNRSVQKCSFDLGTELADRFLIYIFVAGYCIPLTCMCYFYSSILLTLWRKNASTSSSAGGGDSGTQQQTDRAQRSHKRARHVTQRALILVLFYFLCWTPYWLVQFYIQFIMDPDDATRSFDAIFVVLYVVHILTYLNSAVNPFLYALLNKELQQQHSSATSGAASSGGGNSLHATNAHNPPLQSQGTKKAAVGSSLINRCLVGRRGSVEQDPNEMPLLTQSARSNYSSARENTRRP